MKEVLAAIWKLNYKGNAATAGQLQEELKVCGKHDIGAALTGLEKKGFIEKSGNCFILTKKGRGKIKIVVCGGVFDILHPGHAFILNEAKSLGDVLAVIVARDSTVEKRKRIPIVPEGQRMEMVSNLKPVDLAVLGHEGDPLRIIEELKPDVIALGPDQHHDEKKLKDELGKRGINLKVERISEYRECELNSTKAILQRIIERNYPDSRSGD